MALVRQPKTAGFRPKSRYDILVDWHSVVKFLTDFTECFLFVQAM